MSWWNKMWCVIRDHDDIVIERYTSFQKWNPSYVIVKCRRCGRKEKRYYTIHDAKIGKEGDLV